MSNTIRSKILIIEDDPGICTFLKAALVSEGYDVIIVGSGQSALDVIASHCPDCILLDLGLPDMDGNRIIVVHMSCPGWYNETYMKIVDHFRETVRTI